MSFKNFEENRKKRKSKGQTPLIDPLDDVLDEVDNDSGFKEKTEEGNKFNGMPDGQSSDDAPD